MAANSNIKGMDLMIGAWWVGLAAAALGGGAQLIAIAIAGAGTMVSAAVMLATLSWEREMDRRRAERKENK